MRLEPDVHSPRADLLLRLGEARGFPPCPGHLLASWPGPCRVLAVSWPGGRVLALSWPCPGRVPARPGLLAGPGGSCPAPAAPGGGRGEHGEGEYSSTVIQTPTFYVVWRALGARNHVFLRSEQKRAANRTVETRDFGDVRNMRLQLYHGVFENFPKRLQ